MEESKKSQLPFFSNEEFLSFSRVGKALVKAQTRARQADEKTQQCRRVIRALLNSSLNDSTDSNITSSITRSQSFTASFSSAASLKSSLCHDDWDLLESFLYEDLNDRGQIHQAGEALDELMLGGPADEGPTTVPSSFPSSCNEEISNLTHDVLARISTSMKEVDLRDCMSSSNRFLSTASKVLELLSLVASTTTKYLRSTQYTKQLNRFVESGYFWPIISGIYAFVLGVFSTRMSYNKILDSRIQQSQYLLAEVCRLHRARGRFIPMYHPLPITVYSLENFMHSHAQY